MFGVLDLKLSVVRIIGIVGSLRQQSSNAAVLQAAALLAPRGVEIVLYDVLGRLPHFNPDLDTEPLPPIVAALRHAIGACDGILISSPEYAHGIAGTMKNALDWLVSSTEFAGKPTSVINASPRAIHADAQLREILQTMSARIVKPESIMLQLQGTKLGAEDIVRDDKLAPILSDALTQFVDAIRRGKDE